MKARLLFAAALLLAGCGPAESESTTPPECGDGHLDEGESCDDGGDNGSPGHCKSDCSGRYPAANVVSCKAMFKNALSFVDVGCDGDAAFRDAWKALFECRAQSCELALGGDEACTAEDAAFVAAMETYGTCYAKSHGP